MSLGDRAGLRLFAIYCTVAVTIAIGFGQNTTTGLNGRVKDPSGAVVPKAALTLTDTATGIQKETSSTEDGAFVFANLQQGTYSLSAKAAGFQTAVTGNIEISSGRSTEITVEMKIGAAAETVEVAARGAQLETISNEVGMTINSNSIKSLPYTSRDALSFALYMPGSQTVPNVGSTFNGLPNASMNITLDGMNNNSQRFKSGGTSFYAFAPARLDAIEEVSVSTTGLGADAGGQGAMQIRFTTKRGTDKYHFHVLEQMSNEDFNANSYFNKLQGIHRNKTRSANYDGNMGGPLVPFVPYFKHKLFFFMNFEDVPSPGSTVRTTNVLQPEAYQGIYTYLGTDGVNHTINVLQVAGASGYKSTIDPIVSKLMSDIKATQASGSIVQYRPVVGYPFQQTMLWNDPTETTNLYPTVRVDYQITDKVAWHGSWNQRHSNTTGYANYPGGPFPSNSGYKIDAPVTTNVVDWTITPHLLNNFLFGTQGNMEYFNAPSDVNQWARYGNINYSLPLQTPLIPNNTPFKRNNPVYQFSDTVTWVKNKHTITMGGSLLRTTFYENSFPGNSGVPTYSFGVSTADAAGTAIQNAMVALNNNSNDAANAKNLYAQLTGRLTGISTSIPVNENTHQYTKGSALTQRFAFTSAGLFLQDSFRLNPHFTMNYGLRWQFDGVINNSNNIDTAPTGSVWGPSVAPFTPGLLTSNLNPQFNLLQNPYRHDFVNPAPNIGFNWNPSVTEGLLGKLLGGSKTVIGGSYAISYYNEGMNAISNVLSSGPGASQSVSASAAINANPGFYDLTTPLPAFSTTPASFQFPVAMSNYPFLNARTPQYINGNLVSPYAQNWNVRIQREIARGLVFEIRYIGTKSTNMWHYQNVNETNILENGFLKEFQNAQTNLNINTAAGRTGFANNGLAGQVALPIFDAAFGANGTNSALTATQGYQSSTFIQNLQQGQAAVLAQSLASTSSATYYCRLVGSNFQPCTNLGYTANKGYPMNFFRPNPFGNSVMYQDSNTDNNYNGMQIEIRKSFSHGLSLNSWYVLSKTLGDNGNASDQTAGTTWSTLRNAKLSYGPTPFDHRHNFLFYATYDLPVGRGKSLNLNNSILNGVFGNWTVSETTQITTAGPSTLTGGRLTFNDFADGGVVLGNGTTIDSLVNRVKTMTTGNFVSSCTCFKTNVADITQANGSVDPKYLAPAQTPGVMGSPLYYRGLNSYTFNMALKKEFRFKERYRLTFWGEASNFLNHPFFSMGNLSATSTSFGNITGASGTRTIIFRGYLDF